MKQKFNMDEALELVKRRKYNESLPRVRNQYLNMNQQERFIGK